IFSPQRLAVTGTEDVNTRDGILGGHQIELVVEDGIMALFGAPLAHEDHALRACYAALTMQTTMREYAEAVHRAHGIEMRMLMGLNSGEVVVRAEEKQLQRAAAVIGTEVPFPCQTGEGHCGA